MISFFCCKIENKTLNDKPEVIQRELAYIYLHQTKFVCLKTQWTYQWKGKGKVNRLIFNHSSS